jgi:hypothetical protein
VPPTAQPAHTTAHVAAAVPAAQPAPAAAAHATAPKRVATATPVVAAPATTGTRGILQISTKPPCEIVVDGKPIHLVTPQRFIVLPAGSHQLTLINSQQNIRKTVPVTINAHHPTKLIQDFLKKG